MKNKQTDPIWVFLYVNMSENPRRVGYAFRIFIRNSFWQRKESGWFIILSSLTTHLFQTEERLIWQTSDLDDVIWTLYAFTHNLHAVEMLKST